MHVQKLEQSQQSIETLFEGCVRPPPNSVIIEPFAGDGAVLSWLKSSNSNSNSSSHNFIIAYDSDPKQQDVIKRNVFISKPEYYGTYVVTRLPQLDKKDCEDKSIFEQYGTDNLYKCFIKCMLSASQLMGGIIVLPESFLTSLRESHIKRRIDFFKIFKPLRINLFDENTVVINFRKRQYGESLRDIFSCFCYSSSSSSSSSHQILLTENLVRKLQAPHTHTKISVSCYNDAPTRTRTNIAVNPETNRLHLTTDIKARTIYIRGFISNKLQKRLCNDINMWIENQLSDRINKIFPLTPVLTEGLFVYDIIKYFIASYYTEAAVAIKA